MLSEEKHLYNALKRELGFFATLIMTINRGHPFNFQFSILNFQLSTFNFQFSTYFTL